MREIFPGVEEKPASGVEPGRALTLRDVLLLLLRRRHRLILLVTLLGTVGTVALALSSVPQYTATTQILIESQASPIANGPQPSSSRASDLAMIATQVRIIRSRQHVGNVMADLDLYDHPDLRSPPVGGGFGLPASVERVAGEIVARLPSGWLASVGLASQPPPAKLESEPSPRERENALDEFGNRFAVSHDDESQVVTVSFTFADPELAARVVNRSADLFVTRQLDEKLAESRRTLDWMHQRLAEMEGEVGRSEAAVAAYRAENDLIRDLNARSEEDGASELNLALRQAAAEVAELQSRLRSVRRLQDDPDALVGALSSPLLVSLREQELELTRQEAELTTSYGERHPRMLLLKAEKARLQQKLRQEVALLAADVERQLSGAQARQRQIEEQIAGARSRDETRAGAQVGLGELERKVQVDRQVYEFFLQRYRELGEQTQIMASDARVISVAKPPAKPSSLSPRLFGLIGFSISVASGTLLALVLDGLDRRVRGARQVERLFGLKVLDSVPQIGAARADRGQYRYLLKKPLSAYSESLRSIFTSIQLSGGSSPPRVVVVSSALSGEGKTSFAVSLAATAAQWGRRVLVVDLDIRHPCVERTVGAERGLGLTEVLAGLIPVEQALRAADGGFDHLAVGRQPANPAGFIGNERMHALFADLRTRYDFIVVDTAPLLAVADGRVAVKLADKVLLVTRWRHTPVSALRKAVQMLAEIDADIAGVAVLRVDPKSYFIYENEDGANYYPALKKYYVN